MTFARIKRIPDETPSLNLSTKEMSDRTCPADKLAMNLNPKLSERNPIEINSSSIPKNKKTYRRGHTKL